MPDITDELPRLAPIMQNLLKENVLVGPTLTNVAVMEITQEYQNLINQEAQKLVHTYWTTELFSHPFIQPYFQKVVATNAMIDAITSTAAFYAHLRLGQEGLDESMIFVASKLLETSMQRYTPKNIFWLAFIVNAYDDYQAIQYYQPMLATDFVSGSFHRPWSIYRLEEEFKLILDYGAAEWVTHTSDMSIRLTQRGEKHLYKFRQFLEATGFLEKRAQLNRFAGFGQMQDYDDVMNTLTNTQELRSLVLKNAKLKPGMHVLELGCGTGALTLEGGLVNQVGSHGLVTAIDPSVGMLNRSMQKLKSYPESSVKFLQATAEELPFENNTFDAAIGCLFLHFTNIQVTLKEIHRVCKPGAWFTTVYGLQFPQTEPFMTEWLTPIYENNETLRNSTTDQLPSEGTVREIIDTLDETYDQVQIYPVEMIGNTFHIDKTIEFWFRAAHIFEPFMRNLPWKAQQDLIENLTNRGYQIQNKYGKEGMIQHHPGQFLQARVIKV
ncbi:class I SAM-dependent methyltransferase [Alicyclobacillus tolerans]|uniref:Ubiquinone/menaquinone biosynthesis C-methylase UbiE n=1 Tax=Alicyclobacillus tolerans TaxID=90970 RepID=A0ABT9LZ53_9BACL|nr:class I SAM-dependent methyltransferase [Alicyclobacillus tengchongensis]MDP9729553.1 ubiquinone/menaquinone biosynthesis C-methylase UbiE [Alicyclobacillus tengchongensis]